MSKGASATQTGLSQVEPVPVSPADAASIPSEDDIPTGFYCYQSLSPVDDEGIMPVRGKCPLWEPRPGENAYCGFLKYETEYGRELLWDQVKICGVRDHD